jgi:hypothetical protein
MHTCSELLYSFALGHYSSYAKVAELKKTLAELKKTLRVDTAPCRTIRGRQKNLTLSGYRRGPLGERGCPQKFLQYEQVQVREHRGPGEEAVGERREMGGRKGLPHH